MLTVSASVYHLTSASANGLLNQWSSLGGMYHVGIILNGVEWSYGFCERGSGVFAVAPTECSLGPLKECITLGNVEVTLDNVIRILHSLRREWMGYDYSILNKNCITFSRELLKRLSPDLKLPAYTTAMVDLGKSVSTSSHKSKLVDAVDLFGSPEKELMWTTAEKLMREYERGEVPSTILPPVIHSKQQWSVLPLSHSSIRTYDICSSKLHKIKHYNYTGYMKKISTRNLLRSTFS